MAVLCCYKPTTYPAFIDYLRFEKDIQGIPLLPTKQILINSSPSSTEFEIVKTEEITAAAIRSWLANLKAGKMSSKSINRKISTLKSFFRHLLKTGKILQSPMATVVAPKMSKKGCLRLLKKKVLKFYLASLFLMIPGKAKPTNWYCCCFTTRDAAFRIGIIKRNQVDKSYCQIKVLGKGNKERIIPLSKELLQKDRCICRRGSRRNCQVFSSCWLAQREGFIR